MKLKIGSFVLKIRFDHLKNMPSKTLIANRCFINADDCEDALKYLLAAKELTDSDKEKEISFYYDHIEGLVMAAIVSYGRAYMPHRGEGESADFVKVPPGDIFEGDRNKIKLHKKIINLRHKAIAHSDNEFYKNKLLKVEGETAYRKPNSPDLINSISKEFPLFMEMARQAQHYFRKKGLKIDIHQ